MSDKYQPEVEASKAEDGAELITFTGKAPERYHVEYPTAEVTLEQPDGARVTVSIMHPSEDLNLNALGYRALDAAWEALQSVTGDNE